MSEHSIPSNGATRVRQAFLEQAGYCERLGSPFTAVLCRVIGAGLEEASEIERYILRWPGDPSAYADSVPLRVAGALHYLVRAGRAPGLAKLYPPHATPESTALLAAVRDVLREQEVFVRDFLKLPPQTNEVGRSAALIAGWLEIAARTQLPLGLFEIGSSAGLNLIADRYAYQFGDIRWAPDPNPRGTLAARPPALTVSCGWSGRSPSVHAALRVLCRRGCDLHPLNVVDPLQRGRLIAYVWPDQAERLERLSGAIRTMLAEPVLVESAEAADWIEAVISGDGEAGVTRVVFHSIVWSYLDRTSQDRIKRQLSRSGAASSTDRPLAWLRLELAGKEEPATLRLTLWPSGQEELLARVHPHGAWVRWSD